MHLLLGIVIGVFFSPPPPEVVRGALNQVLEGREYQTELPGPEKKENQGASSSGSGSGSGSSATDFLFGGFGWAKVVTIVGIGILAVFLVVGLSRAVAGRRQAYEMPPEGEQVVAPVLDDVPLDEIEALAAQGRFDEAVHVLLLQSIAAVGRTVSLLPASLTSREVLARAVLPAGAAAELESIIEAVETSWFGGREVGREGFEACRERFHRFAALCGAGTAVA